MKKKVLEMVDIYKEFGNVKALKGVQLWLQEGEVLALMGENGAGKSTLMNILCGAIHPNKGKVLIHGQEMKNINPITSREAGVAMIHQELQLIPELSVSANIFLGREYLTKTRSVDEKKMRQSCLEYLKLLELDIKPEQKVKELKIGEQQLVEIAKALSLDASILVMDEPTSALSKAESKKLFNVVKKLSNDGVAIIYITHRMEEIYEICNRVTVFRDGCFIDEKPIGQVTRDDIISMMVGRNVTNIYPKAQNQIKDVVLKVKDLCYKPKGRSNQRALENISFQLNQGEILGVAGLLGSGRSELFDCLFGLNAKEVAGVIKIDDEMVNLTSPSNAIRNKLAYVTEDRKDQGLVLSRSIGENISLPLLKEYSPRFLMRKYQEAKDWKKQMEQLRIKANSTSVLVSNLSGGNQQKVILGRWLLTNPKILLLDEPTRGIDVGAKAEIYGIMTKLVEEGMSIIVISSELPELIGISDRIITLCEGRLTGEFAREEFSGEKILDAATRHREVV